MKRNKISIIVLSVILTIVICIISKEINVTYIFSTLVYSNGDNSDILFSKESGFYDHEFKLYIFAPTQEIYYTLDGSDPDQNSLKYTQPIIVGDASLNSNVYSMRTDVTTRFLDVLDENYIDLSNEPKYQLPNKPVDKCNVIKVVYYDKNGNRSNVEERVFFVDFEGKEGYENINIISITTDPYNLFDYDDGIYVTGKYFDEYYEEGIPERKLSQWEHWESNYNQRGIEWEKESKIHIFDKKRNLVLSQNVGLRIQGGASRGYYPKSLNIYAREEYGANRLNYDFWGTGYIPKRLTLTSGGNDFYTKIKDRLISELVKDYNISTMNYVPYVLFLNGEYWGFYYLTEKYDCQYIEYYYDVNREIEYENIIIIKNGQIETGIKKDKEQYYEEIITFITDNDMSVHENYLRACEMMDMDSFIDYFAIECYIARCGDWPKSNYALWRTRYISDEAYEDGKWRWMLFDVNSTALSDYLCDFDFIEENRQDSLLFDSLCENETFRQEFSDRMIELGNTVFSMENVNQKISEYVQLMDKPMEKHYERFFGTSNELFYSNIEDIREFFKKRKIYTKQIIKKHFGEDYLGENQ